MTVRLIPANLAAGQTRRLARVRWGGHDALARSPRQRQRRGQARGWAAARWVGGGIGGLGVVVVIVYMLLGGDPTQLNLQQPMGAGGGLESGVAVDASSDQAAQFVSVVLADTEETWQDLFGQMGREYPEPRLVLFSGPVQSACGIRQLAVGPFYCPGDRKVYIDLASSTCSARASARPATSRRPT